MSSFCCRVPNNRRLLLRAHSGIWAMCGTWSFRRSELPNVSTPGERELPATSSHCKLPGMSSSSERKLRQTCASCFSVGCAPGTPINGWPILLAVPCGHVFCKPCVAKRCAVGLTDRSLVPAHCCGLEFPIEYVKDALQPSAFATYSLFLAERQWKTTILRSDVEYAATVRSVGGMQCPNCGVGITKISGCEHMQCLCGRSFNYLY